ncbi:hypothetical protein GCM10023264_29200 [Sphingomonas daechungensis]|uniref:Uncharacterized protein n=1 Tax=Sphingomonas daechungensis TaxID=1176646 RepID=A0ABX6SYU5_9SPHN|nr:hypothetical protein [Sphingomonas daechungensis]QNP42474.1 hypothetical protein H9L15_09290 [Sphingomonas daechungensis]
MSLVLALVAVSAGSLSNDQLAVTAMHNFGACVVSETPQGARDILALDYWTEAYDKRMRSIAKGHDRCAPGATLRFNRLLFAGALAEALIKLDAGPDLSTKTAFNEAREPIPARSPSEEMALCAVLNAPQATAAVLSTSPATKQEVDAMRPLGPVLSECLKKGAMVEINKPGLRSMLALAAYRVLSAPTKAAQ